MNNTDNNTANITSIQGDNQPDTMKVATSNPNLNSDKITEQIYRKNLELLQERRRTEQLLYSVSEIVIAVGITYEVTFFNHAAARYLGISENEVLSKNFNDIVRISTEKGQVIKAEEYCFQDDNSKGELEGVILETMNGKFYVNVKTSNIYHENQKTECVVTIVDVTKEFQLDKTKDDFIAITSHELRTPITIIKSYLWMLNSGKNGELNKKQKEYLEKAVKGAERMLALINDTLNISRIEQGKVTIDIEQVNIPEFLKEFDDEFKVKTDEKGLWLKNKLAPDIYNIYADKNKLREVFLNFLGNSAKFTTEGGITITAENDGVGYVKVSIIDTGKGIKQEDLGKLFNKFGRLDNGFTTIAETGGTGLGLYITKIIIEKMGGKVGASSEGLGKGATFWFTLPSADPNTKVCSLVH